MKKIKYLNHIQTAKLIRKLKRKVESPTGNLEIDYPLAFLFIYYAALRVSEAVYMEHSNLSSFTREGIKYYRLDFQALKGSTARIVVLPSWLSPHIDYHLEFVRREGRSTAPEARLFNFKRRLQLSRMWNAYRPLDFDGGIHSLRHTRAMELYEKTKDLLFLQKWLGHRYFQNTLVYAQCYEFAKKSFEVADFSWYEKKLGLPLEGL